MKNKNAQESDITTLQPTQDSITIGSFKDIMNFPNHLNHISLKSFPMWGGTFFPQMLYKSNKEVPRLCLTFAYG